MENVRLCPGRNDNDIHCQKICSTVKQLLNCFCWGLLLLKFVFVEHCLHWDLFLLRLTLLDLFLLRLAFVETCFLEPFDARLQRIYCPSRTFIGHLGSSLKTSKVPLMWKILPKYVHVLSSPLEYSGPTASRTPLYTSSPCKATTIARLLYASPALCGLTSEKDSAAIERVCKRLKEAGFRPASDAPNTLVLGGQAKESLFWSIESNSTRARTLRTSSRSATAL